MATFTSPKAKASAARRYRETGLVIEHVTYTGSAALSAGDVIQMVKVPAGARVFGYTVTSNAASTSATGTFSLGDGVDPDRYMVAQALDTNVGHGGVGAHANNGYEYSADDTIDVVAVTVGGNTDVTPVVSLTIGWFCDN